MKRIAHFLIRLTILMPMIGCGAVNSTTPPAALAPGALNSFDQTSFQTLLAVQATINSLQASYTANPTGLANIKIPLNQASTDYNIADLAWQTYHAAATAANQAAVASALTKVQTDVASIKVTP